MKEYQQNTCLFYVFHKFSNNFSTILFTYFPNFIVSFARKYFTSNFNLSIQRCISSFICISVNFCEICLLLKYFVEGLLFKLTALIETLLEFIGFFRLMVMILNFWQNNYTSKLWVSNYNSSIFYWSKSSKSISSPSSHYQLNAILMSSQFATHSSISPY